MLDCYPNTSNFVKNTPLRDELSTLVSVFGYPDERLSLVFDILLFKLFLKISVCLCLSRLVRYRAP